MATINAVIRWADNTDQLRKNLQQGINQLEATKASVESLAKSLGGEKLVQAAHRSVAAIMQIGGATKLTAQEAERQLALISRAMEKLELAGKPIPDAMRAMKKELEAVAAAGRPIESLSDRLKTLGQGMQTVGQNLRGVGTSLTAAITVPMVGLGTFAVKAAMDFESSFAGVRKTVDATDAEFAQMEQQFRDLAKTIPVNVNELNRLGEAAGALGIPKGEIVDFARVMAELGVTTNVTSDAAAESIAKIQNMFGAAGKETENFASALVDLGNKGASTEHQILEMATRLSSAASSIGITQAQVLGMASAISNVGIEAEAGGSAMSRVMSDIAVAVAHGGAAVEKFAKVSDRSAAEFARIFKTDAAEAIRLFIEGLGRVKEAGGDLILTVEELGFSEIRQSNLLRALAGNYKDFGFSLDTATKAWKANTALSTEAQERFKTTESQLTLLWNRVKDVAITLGIALNPAITSVVHIFNTALPVLDRFAKWFADLPGGVQLAVLAFVALLAAIGPIVFIAGQLIFSTGQIVTAFSALTASSGAAATGVTGLNASLGALNGMTLSPWLMRLLGIGGAVGLAAIPVGVALAQAEQLQRDLEAANRAPNRSLIPGAREGLISPADARAQAEKVAKEMGDVWEVAIPPSLAKAVATGVERATQSTTFTAQLEKARQEIAALSAATRSDLVAAIDSGVFSMEDMQKQSRLSELALKLFKEQVQQTSKAHKDATENAEKWNKAVASLRFPQLASRGGLNFIPAIPANPFTELSQVARDFSSELMASQIKVDMLGNAIKVNLLPSLGGLTQTFEDDANSIEALRYEYERLAKSSVATVAEIADAWEAWYAREQALHHGFVSRWLKTLSTLNAAFVQLAQVGEGALGNFAKAVSAVLSALEVAAQGVLTFQKGLAQIKDGNFGEGFANMAAGVLSAVAAMDAATSSASKLRNVLGGAAVGAQIGEQLGGPIGAGIGAGVGALVGLFRDPKKRMIDTVLNPARDEWFESVGTLEDLNAQMMALTGHVGLVRAVFDADTMEEFEAATAQVNELLAANQKVIQSSLGVYGDLEKKFEGITVMTPDLKAAMDKAMSADSSLEMLEALKGISIELDKQKQRYNDINGLLAKYKIDVGEVKDPVFKQQKIGEQALELRKDFDLARSAGIDMNAFMRAAGKSVNEFVQSAIKMGVEVPESMRQVIQTAIDAGEIFDANGKKIATMDQLGLTFGQTMAETVKTIETVMDRLLIVLEGIAKFFGVELPNAAQDGADALQAALDGIEAPDLTINVGYDIPDLPNGITYGEGHPDYGSMGGLVTEQGIQRFAEGGKVLNFVPRGIDTQPAMLAVGEGVVNRSGMQALGDDGLARLNSGRGLDPGGGSHQSSVVINFHEGAIQAGALVHQDDVEEFVTKAALKGVEKGGRNFGRFSKLVKQAS